MNATRTFVFSAMLGAVIGLLIAGCSSEDQASITTPDDAQTVDLDAEYGGFLAVEESPAFGDTELSESDDEEDLIEDGYEGLTEQDRVRAREIEAHNQRVWYSVTFVWGMLDRERDEDLEPTDPVTWDGTMTFEQGAIRPLSRIAFEPSEDYLIHPRVGPEELSWASVTHGGADGLRVLLTLPPDETGQGLEGTLHFESEPFGSHDFDISELESLDEVYDIEGSDEQLSVVAFRVDTSVESNGFCHGCWGWKDEETGEGVRAFKGRWVSAEGHLQGHVRGHYGVDSDGEQVFFGKYIDRLGRFQGFLRGHYEVSSGEATGSGEQVELGRFWGNWLDAHGNALGDLRGHWSRRDGERPGVFSGVWRGTAIRS